MGVLATGRCLAVWRRVNRLVLAATGLVAFSCVHEGETRTPLGAPAPAVSVAPLAVVSSAAATSAASAQAVPAASVPVADPCRVAQAVTDAAIARAQAYAEAVMAQQLASGVYKGEKPELPITSFVVTDWLSCTKTPGGAWAIVLANAELVPINDWDWKQEWVLTGEVMLAHVDAGGSIVMVPIQTQAGGGVGGQTFENAPLFPRTPNCCETVFGGLEAIELFDFDHDGEPEVHVGASYGHEGVSERSDDLFTFKAGKLERYAPAAKHSFEAVKDQTGDGIPDLLMAEGLSGGESCGSEFPFDGRGQTFIAHALPDGTFSPDDAAARAFAKKACPTKPRAIKDLNDVLCARLWGADSTKLELQVRARFLPWDCDAEMASRPQKPRANLYYLQMLSATKAHVPFTLP
jgi:ferredoxin